jgi:hypothetical protein
VKKTNGSWDSKYVQNIVNMTFLDTFMRIQFMTITTEITEFLLLKNVCASFVKNSKETPSCDTNAYTLLTVSILREKIVRITLRNILAHEDRQTSQ